MNRGLPRHNKSGYKGVSREGNGWRAQIQDAGKNYRLGTFDTPEEAYEAYKKEAIKRHGEFANSGEPPSPSNSQIFSHKLKCGLRYAIGSRN